MKMICISSMGESAQSYVESTTVLSEYSLIMRMMMMNVQIVVTFFEVRISRKPR